MAALSIALLAAAVAGAILRPWGLPAWAAPAASAAAALGSGALGLGAARRAIQPLGAPIGFLLAAVPLAVLLDRLGFFSSVATLLTSRRRGGAAGLWALAAVVTTVLNLDASVVLLTPLYVRVARQSGRDPLQLGIQPVLLALLASSALPVSNLTNLIAASETGASTASFLLQLGLPSLAATVVGWIFYRRLVLREGNGASPALGEVDRRALLLGSAVVVVALAGFVLGQPAGIEPWMVALGADVVLVLLLRRLPLRQVPLGTALVAASLGLLAAAAASHLPLAPLLSGSSTAALARISAVTALGANVVNNLPALLVALPFISRRVGPPLWAVMVGVNMGPVLLVTGSLASLLWLETLGRLEVQVRARDFSWAGVRVGLPAALAGLGVHLLMYATGVVS